MDMKKRIIVGISGASGTVYGITLLKELILRPIEVHVILTEAGRQVLAHELEYEPKLIGFVERKFNIAPHPESKVFKHSNESFFTPPASGSFRHDGMVIAPCSMKTLASVSSGTADNLITRAADISLKERRPLILVARETPLSRIHLDNMLRATDAGAVILPACPAFYFEPRTVQDLVNFVVGRILDQLGIDHDLLREWGNEDSV
jgi:4-hydroxy-3-polyprenylbenzoate decarboxylase